MAASPDRIVEPANDLVPIYRETKQIYRDLYQATRGIQTRLAALSG